jgi:hypothetical protein
LLVTIPRSYRGGAIWRSPLPKRLAEGEVQNLPRVNLQAAVLDLDDDARSWLVAVQGELFLVQGGEALLICPSI